MLKLSPISLALLIFLSAATFSQERAAYFDLQAEIIPPAGYDAETEYPLLIMLPYTTGTAAEFYNRYRDEIGTGRYILLLPKGRPLRTDYLPNFMQYVDWYEERLLSEIERAERLYSVDTDKRILAGYSLGGDLSWALTMKRPELFAGAVMAGTRCSYPPERSDLDTLKRKGYKAAFFIGSREDINRYDGINAARWTLENAGIETRYTEIDGGHIAAPVEMFVDALNWISAGEAGTETAAGESGTAAAGVGPDAVSAAETTGDPRVTCTLRLVNNSGVVINSIDRKPDSRQRLMPLMGTYRGDAPLRPGEEISFDLSYGDSVIIEGAGGFKAETPKVRENVLMILRPNGRVRVYK